MRILFSMLNAAGFGGAATVVLELAEEFRILGHEVDLCAWWMANPMASLFTNAGVHRRDDIAGTNPFDYDIVIFLHHSAPIHFTQVRAGSRNKTLFLFFRLSHTSNIGVPSPIIEDLLADHWFVNSEEVRHRMLNTYGVPSDKIFVFHNAAPRSFAQTARTDTRPLRHIIYVSNHKNSEVVDALRVLRMEYGLRTTHYGQGGDKQIRITASEIHDADVVITMAKTAQFALLNRAPLYIYDYRWGGPGYLNSVNFNETEASNFSGSSSPRILNSRQIADEIVSGYDDAAEFALHLPAEQLQRYSLARVLEKIQALYEAAEDNTSKLVRLVNNEHLVNRERAYVETTRFYFRRERQVARNKEPSHHGEIIFVTTDFRGAKHRLAMIPGDYITRQVQRSGQFYEAEMLAFIHSLNRTGIYFDVGANVGNHSVFFAEHCACTKVIAFEPSPLTFEVLDINTRLTSIQGRIQANPCAIADFTGTCSLIEAGATSNTGMTKRSGGSDHPVRMLDDFVPSDQRIGLIKIDVEGDELAVLRGAASGLARDLPDLFVEAASTTLLSDIMQVLAPIGYSVKAKFNHTATYYFSVG